MFMALQVLCTDISVECFSLPLSLSLSLVFKYNTKGGLKGKRELAPVYCI